MAHRYNKNYKRKKYSTTQKILYKTGQFLGGAKESIKKGWQIAERVAPKVGRYARATRAEVAREFGEPEVRRESIQQPTQRRYPTQNEIDNLNRLRERIARLERKGVGRVREPFSRVAREQRQPALQLGWGGF